MKDLHIVELGKGEPVVMVHGSFGWGEDTFGEQRPLADHFRLLLVDRRGFGKSPSTGRVDFDSDADDIGEILSDGAHLVGHSYGGVVSLLTAARGPKAVKSLTVIEPPAFKVAIDDPIVRETVEWLKTVYASGKDRTPQQFYATFARTSVDSLPPFSEDEISAIRASMTERPPYEADIPLSELAKASYPKLVVSGGRQRKGQGPALIKVCDILERELGARRATFDGAGHNPQISHPHEFNKVLKEFLETA